MVFYGKVLILERTHPSSSASAILFHHGGRRQEVDVDREEVGEELYEKSKDPVIRELEIETSLHLCREQVSEEEVCLRVLVVNLGRVLGHDERLVERARLVQQPREVGEHHVGVLGRHAGQRVPVAVQPVLRVAPDAPVRAWEENESRGRRFISCIYLRHT